MMPVAPLLPANLDVLNCSLDGISLIEASAGTGKTWTICGLYLRLLLERSLSVQQILVVTFTNAATAELRERIRARLVEMLACLSTQGEVDPFITQLASVVIERAGGDGKAVIDRLELALQCFDEASIFTIHGFCQHALADTPFSAGMPMRTELLESDRELVMQVVNDFWRRHVAGDSMTPELANYLIGRNDSPGKYAELFQRHLAKPLAQPLWPLDIDAPSMDTAELVPLYQQLVSSWSADQVEIDSTIRAALGSLDKRSYKEELLQVGAAQWAALCMADDYLADTGTKTFLYRASELKEKTSKKKGGPQPPVHRFFDYAEAFLAARERLQQSLSLARARLLRTLFAEARVKLRELKESRQVIAFSDMLANVHERLFNPRFSGLAAAIKTRFPAALIDEFQDTDPQQFAVFQAIYTDSRCHVFVVGDPKQAIYGFRHADLHTYLSAKTWASTEKSLLHNQRSTAALLSALNGLFECNSNAFMLPKLNYRRVDCGAKPRQVLVDATQPRAALQVWMLPELAEPLPKSVAKREAARATAVEIARLLRAGATGEITLDAQGLQPRDIAVLVRTRALGLTVKLALAELKVGSVEITRNSIFHTSDAQDLEIVLTAILSPTRVPLVRAALVTALFGCNARTLEAMSASEDSLLQRIRSFADYRELWLHDGFGVMYRRLITQQSVARRLLSQTDGERRLTNFLHLGEILQQAADLHDAPDALLRYLKSERDTENSSDAAQLRLESDQNLVQIVTVHASKGLEYPVVFCPFLCDGTTSAGHKLEGREYHDTDLQPVIDFCEYDDNDAQLVRIKAAQALEQAAETVRLLYVALTRASHRCYLVAGLYRSNRSSNESSRSMLNWLVAGQGLSVDDWFDKNRKQSAADIANAWRQFAQDHPGSVDVAPLPAAVGTPLSASDLDATQFATPAALFVMAGGWRISSYSGLSYGAKSEQAAGDHDARAALAQQVSVSALPSDAVAQDDVLRFPRGASAGECIHAVFEEIDFTNSASWPVAITQALDAHPQSLLGVADSAQQENLASMLTTLVENVTQATLLDGLRLSTVPLRRRLSELEFMFPATLSAPLLNALLAEMGYAVPGLQFRDLAGYLKGFIDLVFEHEGRFFILDWKSNHLGYEAVDYAAAPMAAAMQQHGYHLQYLLYAVALDRYLRARVENYCYETHMGGVLYLFVRGVRPTWPGVEGARPGVYFHRPSELTIRRLNELLVASAGVDV